MSDPSPWAEEKGLWDDDFYESTKENLKRAELERDEEEREAFWNERLWSIYAARLKKDGGLTR